MAHIRQSRPDSGLGFQVKVLHTLQLFPLRSEADAKPKLRAVPIGTVLNFRTTTSQKCEAGPRRARIQGS